MPTPPHQSALFAGPGRFPALAFYAATDPQANDTPKKVRDRAAHLLKAIELNALATEQVLVTVSANMLKGHSHEIATPDIEPPDTGPTGFEFQFDAPKKTAVLVQVSAETAEDRVHALRLAREILTDGDVLKSTEELLSDLRTTHREPFGYPDTRRGHIPDDIQEAAVSDTPNFEGSSWVFYQRLVQNLPDFFNHDADRRDSIMGIDLQGRLYKGGPPPEPNTIGHVKLARPLNRSTATGRPTVIRRGFPYRASNGDEGLVFLAATHTPKLFKQMLQTMLVGGHDGKHDALLAYIATVEAQGGLFFVPPNADWLADGAGLPAEIPVSEQVRSIERASDEALLLYPFTPAGLAYMNRMRDELVFGNPVGRIDRVPNPDDEVGSPVSLSAIEMTDEIHTKMAGGDDSIDDLLPKLDQIVLDIANQLDPGWKNEAPPVVVELVDDISNAAAGGPLTAVKVKAADGKLEDAIAAANLAVTSGVHYIPALVRELLNATAQIAAGPTIPDPTIKTTLDAMRDEALEASAKVNQGEGYYITING